MLSFTLASGRPTRVARGSCERVTYTSTSTGKASMPNTPMLWNLASTRAVSHFWRSDMLRNYSV